MPLHPRIGVTGATGVLGTRILAALEARNVLTDVFAGDVREVEAVTDWAAGCDVVLHAAALVPVGQVADHPGSAITVNVAGTANVARAASRAGARLVYISTAHVYRSSDHPLSEDAPIEPVSLYGLSKLQGEQWASALCKDTLILRVFSYFDARQAPTYLVPALCERIRAAEHRATLPLMGAASVRDMADATWLGTVCAELATRPLTGVFNISAGCVTTVQNLATRMALMMGRDDVRWVVDPADRPNSLAADRSRLERAIELPPFSLDAALSRFVETAAPRSLTEVRQP